jgi:hypothetical protein
MNLHSYAHLIFDKGAKNIQEPIKKWAIELNRTFSKEEIQMAKNNMKKCSPSLDINQSHTKILPHPL